MQKCLFILFKKLFKILSAGGSWHHQDIGKTKRCDKPHLKCCFRDSYIQHHFVGSPTGWILGTAALIS